MLNARWIVIEGFRIEMAAQELIGISETGRSTIATPPSNATGDARGPPRRREAAFVFLRDHVPAHEVYRLDWSDMGSWRYGRHAG